MGLKNQNNSNSMRIFGILKKEYPNAAIALKHENPFQLLVATILSAQCTDKRVNIVTKSLFKKFKTVRDFANARQKDLEREVFSTGFYHNKAKNIINAAKMVLEKFEGNGPETMNKLIQLPGVARKTANIVLSGGFGKIDGIAVDTHVMRLSQRLGFSKHKSPEKIEIDLMKIFPKKDWPAVSNVIIWHGREICSSRKPLCTKCAASKLCQSAFKVKGFA